MGFYPGRAEAHNGVLSIDEVLADPTVISDRIADIAGQDLLVEKVFSQDNAPVSGGTVIYSKTTQKHLYTSNDVADRQPGDEYPVVYSDRPELEIARVEDFGGKFAVSDEARRRNLNIDFDNDVTRLANTVTRKLNQRAIETIEAAEESGETINYAAAFDTRAWWDVKLEGNSADITPATDRPTAAISMMFQEAQETELGINYTHILMSPWQYAGAQAVYGDKLAPTFEQFGLEPVISTNINQDKMYLVDQGKAGFIKYEMPLTVDTWRDHAHRQDWIQAFAMPVMGITLPAAIAVIDFSNSPYYQQGA